MSKHKLKPKMPPTSKTIITLLLLAATQALFAQEKLSPEEALQYASAVGQDSKQLSGTPIPTDVDTQQPIAIRDGEFGGMVLPQKNLNADSLDKPGENIIPIGQLWLLKLGPMKDGAAISRHKLRWVTVQHDGDQTTVPQCALGVRRTRSNPPELLVFGKDKEPILSVPMKTIQGRTGPALDMNAERNGDEGSITLKILGKYEATFAVTELEL